MESAAPRHLTRRFLSKDNGSQRSVQVLKWRCRSDCEQLIDLVEATPAGPARPTGGKTLNKPNNTAGATMQNQPAGRTRSMTLSRYVRVLV